VFVINIPASAAGLVDGDFPGTGYMTKVGTGSYTTVKVNLSATTDPGAGNDASQGYTPGSTWVNLNTNTVYFCGNAAIGAAVWTTSGAGITSINVQTGPSISFQTGTTGTDFGITAGSNIVHLNLPDAGPSARGLVTTGTQTLAGFKVLTGGLEVGGGLTVVGNNPEILAAAAGGTDFVGLFSSLTTGWVNVEGLSGSKPAMYIQHDGSGMALQVTGPGGGVEATCNGTAPAVEGVATSTGQAGFFFRAVNGATTPEFQISRAAASDTQTLLYLADGTASTAATYALSYSLNNVIMLGLQPNGQFVTELQSTTVPTFSFIADPDSGFGEISSTGGDPVVIDEGNVTAEFHWTGSKAQMLVDGSFTATDILANTTHAVCVKSDGYIGTCSSNVNGSGVCTCA
jgi:hypothetical protein